VDNKHIESLIIKYLTRKADKEEEQIVVDWIDQSAKNKRSFEVFQKLWNDSNELMLPGKIDVEAALQNSKKQIPEFRRKTRWLSYWPQVAAVLVLSIFISSVFTFLTKPNVNSQEQAIYQEIKAAFGTQTKLQLADGTTVWLNAGSQLSFPVSFNNQDERKVKLVGEGYFEVAKNAKQPFVVSTAKLDIKVLGTSFNVNAYENEDNITVALQEGKVSLLQQLHGRSREILDLNPLEVANYDIENNKINHSTETDLDRYVAWKDGLIVFFDDPMEKVISRLENWYNVDIEVNDEKLLKEHITGTFNDNSLDQVLHLLSLMSPIDYKYVPVDGGVKNQKVILFRK
jgi:ferric-dicitrate binding protein FerR (iron transport regulator)